MKTRREHWGLLLLLPLLPFFSAGVYAQLPRDPGKDLSVTFSSKPEPNTPGIVFGKVANKSSTAYPCVHVEFTCSPFIPPAWREARTSVSWSWSWGLQPRTVRDCRSRYPSAAIGLKSVTECVERPSE
jgi:hypothetical protein